MVKCQSCGKRDTDKQEMIKDTKGYYHPSCHKEIMEEKEMEKCKLCGKKDTNRKDMIQEAKGYYHPSPCYEKLLEEKEFKLKEREEKDALVDTIVRIHELAGRQSIPPTFYSSFLEPLRNDDVLFGRIQKRYKEGFDYKTIMETYLYCEENIKKYVKRKRDVGAFKDTMGELRYALNGIVKKNFENMIRAKRKAEKAKYAAQQTIENSKILKDVKTKMKNRKTEPRKIIEDDNEIDLTTLFD